MIGAGDLDRRVVIERASVETNSLNEEILTFAQHASVAARRMDVSDGEKVEAGQLGSSLISRFVVRSSSATRTVTPKDRILHETKYWNILGVKETADGRRRFIEITAARDGD